MSMSSIHVFDGGVIPDSESSGGSSGSANIKNLIMRDFDLNLGGETVSSKILCDYDSPQQSSPYYTPVSIEDMAQWTHDGFVMQVRLESQPSIAANLGFLARVSISHDSIEDEVTNAKVFTYERLDDHRIKFNILNFDKITDEVTSIDYLRLSGMDEFTLDSSIDTTIAEILDKIPSTASANNKLVTEQQLENATASMASGYTPKGPASVSTLNGLTDQENGDQYIVTDSGTLTYGSLAVTAGESVAWDSANDVWYKVNQYALNRFGTNEVKNLAQTASESDLVSSNYIPVDTPEGPKKLPSSIVPACKIVDRGSATVATINALTFKQAGWQYFVTDSGTLNEGNVDVVRSDVVTWSDVQNKWTKTNLYAQRSVQKNLVESICKRFLETKNYKEGEFVELDGMVYRFNEDHPTGAWNSSQVEEWDWDSILFSIIESEVATSRAAALSVGGIFADGVAWSYRINSLNCAAMFPASNYIIGGNNLHVCIQCRELAGQTLNVSGHGSDKTKVEQLADITLNAEGVAEYSVKIENPATVYIRLYKQDSGDLIYKRKFFYGGKIIASSDSLNNKDLNKLNAIGYEDVHESISLENKLYEPWSDTPIESTNYWSIKLYLKAGDEIGFLDDSLWSQVKINFGLSSWIGYQSENVILPSDGMWTIAITRLEGATISWDSTINNIFGKIVKRPCINETGLSAEVQAKLNKGDNPLVGKKLACLGDSLTHGMGLNNSQTWGYMIADRNAMTFYNYGVNGNPIASKGNIHGMAERYTEMPNGCQYITVMGGANDMNQEIPIGENSDNTIYTFKGAINVLIDGLRTKYPSGHICFMTSFKRYPDTQEKNYADAMREVCALKAIPCKDNYTDSGIDFTNASQAAVFGHQTYARHFSEAGNEFISWGIEAFLKAH